MPARSSTYSDVLSSSDQRNKVNTDFDRSYIHLIDKREKWGREDGGKTFVGILRR